MSLQVWLPLNGNLNNQGLSNTILTNAGATVDDNGKIGKCYKFTSSQYLYNDNFELSTSAFSVCYWVKYSSFPTYNGYVISLNNTSSTDYQFMIGAQGTNGNYTLNASKIPCTMELDKWYHCAVTWQGTTARMYLNGELVGTYTVSVNEGAKHLTVNGRYGSRGGMNFVVNDIRIYDHCLSIKEVKELSKGLVLHYKLDNKGVGNLNLFSSFKVGGHTTLSGGNLIIAKQDSISDTYFYINTTEALKAETYTLSVNYKSFTGASTWHFSLFAQSTPIGVLKLEPNQNFASTTFTLLSDSAYIGRTQFILDDATRPTSNPQDIILYNVKLEYGNKATPWCPNSADTSYTSLGYNSNKEIDCSGNIYNADIIGTLGVDAESSRYSSSVLFSLNNQYIKLPVINMSGFADSYTFSWWSKTANMSGRMAWGFSNGNRLNVFPSTYFCWNTGDGGSNQFKNNGTSVAFTPYQDSKWHHYVVTGDGTKNDLYIDGVYVGTSITYKPLTGTQIYISGWDTGTSYKWLGSMSDFRIYATVLSPSDIKELYTVKASADNKGNLFCGEVVEK